MFQDFLNNYNKEKKTFQYTMNNKHHAGVRHKMMLSDSIVRRYNKKENKLKNKEICDAANCV